MNRCLVLLTCIFSTSACIAESGTRELQGRSSGTCFFVDAFGTALTNNHVVAGVAEIMVVAANGASSPASITKVSENLDLALLSTGLQTPDYLSLAPVGSLSLGQAVFTIGYPATSVLGDAPKYSEGAVGALTGLNNDDSWIQMSTPIQPGNSGGPLVDQNGQVVGVVTATAAVESFLSATGALPQNVNWAVKADYAAPMFPKNVNNFHASTKIEAISHTEKSICRVVGTNPEKRYVRQKTAVPEYADMTDTQKLSYLLGMDIGKSLREQHVLSIDRLIEAIRVTYEGGIPEITHKEAEILTEEFVNIRRSGGSLLDGEKLGYVIGMDIGKSIREQGTVLNLDALEESIRTVYKGGTPKMTPGQAEALRQAYTEKRKAKAGSESGTLHVAEKAEGEAFLRENQGKEGVQVTSSGLQYKVIRRGNGQMPRLRDTVVVHYRGTLIDGTEFDNSRYARNKAPISFKLNQVIAGWTEGLQLMPVGSTYKFWIRPELAYGEVGGGPIPPNATLIFEVELLKVTK